MENKRFITKPSYIENPPKPPVTKKEKVKKLSDSEILKEIKTFAMTCEADGRAIQPHEILERLSW